MNPDWIQDVAAHVRDGDVAEGVQGLIATATMLRQVMDAALVHIRRNSEPGARLRIAERIAELGNVIIGSLETQLRQVPSEREIQDVIAVTLGHIRSDLATEHLVSMVECGNEDYVLLAAGSLFKCNSARLARALLARINKPLSDRLAEGLLNFCVKHRIAVPSDVLDRLAHEHHSWGVDGTILELRNQASHASPQG